MIENGTRETEIRVFGVLSGLGDLIEGTGIKGPALLIIGETAGLPLEALAQKALLETQLSETAMETAL